MRASQERREFEQEQDEKRSQIKPLPFKVHYAPYGEWGGERVNCGKYYTTDVAYTGDRDKVTCKFCQRLFE